MQKQDLSVHEMLFIRTLKLNLNVQSDSFVPKTKAEARLVTLTETPGAETSIILDITKTESNNCFITDIERKKIKVMFLLLR